MSKHLLCFAEAVAADVANRITSKLEAHPGGVDRPFIRKAVLRAFGCTCLIGPGAPECPLHPVVAPGLTDELVERYAAEAEQGYDTEKLRPRYPRKEAR